jgi:glycosyltransferase involved in cell wall biosynthesis
MITPRISVAMSVYNNAPFLAEAIESILGQSFADFEFLILNDGSTDGSGGIIDSFAARDPRVRAIHQPNAGLIVSLNRLLHEARAPLVARMDGDDIALPDRFALQLAFLEAHPEVGVVGTNTRDIDVNGELRDAREAHPLTHQGFLAAMSDGPLLCHPSVMMRSDLVRDVGGYRAAYHHCEDYDLWLRLSSRTHLCSIPERMLHYRRSESQVSNRHVLAQQYGAAVAWQAHLARASGQGDPTEGLTRLPPLDELDRLFGREGVARSVRARIAPNLLYSRLALIGDGYDLLIDHVRDGGPRDGLWRTVARLMTFGAPVRAVRLAAALAVSRG